MKKIALDTNAYSALLSDNNVVAEITREAIDIGLPIIVLGEINYGVLNGSRISENFSKLQGFLDTNRVSVLCVDEKTALIFGEIATELKAMGKPIQQNDIWIASLCKQYDYTLISNDKGFSNVIGLKLHTFNL